MSRFVDDCRKEWKRLGVPEAVSEEMAADLSADLAEAEAEGASPEHVLGNGVFDARTFAASWAAARGVVRPGTHHLSSVKRSPWTFAVGAATSLFVAFIGLALATSGHASMAAVVKPAFAVPFPDPGGPPRFKLGPFPAGQVFMVDGPRHVVGWILLAAGLIGLGLTLWLWRRWKPGSGRWRGRAPEDNVALPSYL